jgi:hypothetical protein
MFSVHIGLFWIVPLKMWGRKTNKSRHVYSVVAVHADILRTECKIPCILNLGTWVGLSSSLSRRLAPAKRNLRTRTMERCIGRRAGEDVVIRETSVCPYEESNPIVARHITYWTREVMCCAVFVWVKLWNVADWNKNNVQVFKWVRYWQDLYKTPFGNSLRIQPNVSFK